MHVELLVPALLLGRAPRERLPALELLLARSRQRRDSAMTLEQWLMAAFDAGDGCPAGALSLLAAGATPGDACWVRADPVHLLQQREMLVMMPAPSIRVAAEEAEALCGALNAHFGDAFVIRPVEPERWSARLAVEGRLEALPPLEAAGRNADAVLPQGDAKRWHALLNEVQMLLHGHPVNAAREARGERPVNSLWLWGAGRMPANVHGDWQTVTADDPLARGLARARGVQAALAPDGAEAWLARLPAEGRHLAVLDALRIAHAFDDASHWEEAVAALETHWAAPLLAALRAGRVNMVTIHVPDGTESRSHETARGDLRRFWRRPKPLDGS